MKKNKRIYRILAFVSAFVGLSMLAYVFSPLLAYELLAPRYATYLSPVPLNEIPNFKADSAARDFTDPLTWFEGEVSLVDTDSSKVRFYNISIPRLKIKDATVAIGGEDLSDSLIQYPGTAYPGKRGNAVIFGHSILPQFYDPKDYLSIFSTLNTLKEGDEIVTNYDGVVYKYLIEDIFEVSPTDIQILEQNSSSSFLTLVTCTPPGHPLRPRRLIVRARIAPYNTATNNGNTWN